MKTEKKSYSFLQLDEESAVCIPRDSKLTKAEVGESVNKDCLAEFVNSLLQPAYIHCDTDEIPVKDYELFYNQVKGKISHRLESTFDNSKKK